MLELAIYTNQTISEAWLHSLNQHKNIKVTGIIDPNHQIPQNFLNSHQLYYSPNIEEILPHCNLIMVCQEVQLKAAEISLIIRASKDLLFERHPVHLHYDELNYLNKLAMEAHTAVMVNNPLYSSSHIQELLKEINHPQHIALSDYLPHDLNTRQYSQSFMEETDLILRLSSRNLLKIQVQSINSITDSPDRLELRLVFEQGLHANLLLNRICQKEEREITIYQNKKAIQSHFGDQVFLSEKNKQGTHHDKLIRKEKQTSLLTNTLIPPNIYSGKITNDLHFSLDLLKIINQLKEKTVSPKRPK